MAKRQAVKTYPSNDVQGEGSYVKISGVKVREIRAARKMAEDPEVDEFEAGLEILKRHIVAWDWVDDLDAPLALPSENPEILDELTNEEAAFLVDLLMGAPKN